MLLFFHTLSLFQLQETFLTKQDLRFCCFVAKVSFFKTSFHISNLFLYNILLSTQCHFFSRFLDAYKEEGIDVWGITTGNEPINGIIPINRFNAMGWSATSQRKWIAKHFGPTLRNSEHNETKLIALDDQRFFLPRWIETVSNYAVTSHFY